MHAHCLIDSLLDCGHLDTDFLLPLIDAYDLDTSELLDDLHDFIGDARPNVNHLIYAAFEQVATQFLTREVKRRAARFSSTEYTIFTNCLDSHLWVENAELQRWLELWHRHSLPLIKSQISHEREKQQCQK